MTSKGTKDRRHHAANLRAAVADGERLIGTFVKTPQHHGVEVLARTALNFIVLDTEHAPFTRATLDTCVLAAQAGNLPVLVRTATTRAEHILQALDCGADGILVPHVNSAETASAVVKAARYRESSGSRGFSNSPRAGGYGDMNLATHIEKSDQRTTVVVQIETAESVDNIEEITSVAGVDGLFVGRADLAVSYGVDTLNHPKVQEAVERIARVAREGNRPAGIFLPDAAELASFVALGFTFFIVGSDQSMLKRAANDIAVQFQ